MLKFVNGDLLGSDCTYICHQCNCVTSYGKGLSSAMFSKFPYANIYSERISKNRKDSDFFDNLERKEKSVPGHIIVKGNGKDERFVINMLAQYYPGPSKYGNDSEEKRLRWFQDCLDEMGQLVEENVSFAFPYQIGCGLAGGKWDKYLEMIQKFQKKHKILVSILKKD